MWSKQLAIKKDNFVANVGDWALVKISIKRHTLSPLSQSLTASPSYIYIAAKEIVHEYDQSQAPSIVCIPTWACLRMWAASHRKCGSWAARVQSYFAFAPLTMVAHFTVWLATIAACTGSFASRFADLTEVISEWECVCEWSLILELGKYSSACLSQSYTQTPFNEMLVAREFCSQPGMWVFIRTDSLLCAAAASLLFITFSCNWATARVPAFLFHCVGRAHTSGSCSEHAV